MDDLGTKKNPYGQDGDFIGLTKDKCPGMKPNSWYIIDIDKGADSDVWVTVDGIGGRFPRSNFDQKTISSKGWGWSCETISAMCEED